jgi:two-component system phosphate regulon sensor histidine kinase PhoR
MNFTSRVAAMLLAFLICLATTGLLRLVDNVPAKAYYLVGFFSFSSSFLLIYIAFEFLVFREINQIYKLLDRIKRKELKQVKKRLAPTMGPMQKLNDEILLMANKKQDEIEELRKIETYRREFVADISHELKTPLFAAQGFIHTLLDGADHDQTVRDRFLQKAANNLDGLNDMIQELLTLSQLETGMVRMKREIVDIGLLSGEVTEALAENAEAKQIELKVERNPSKPLWVEADRSRIRQVLTNLIDNAIKYHQGGSGVISISFEAEKDSILVMVNDNGPGISIEHINRIFDRFYRIEKSRSKDSGGTGLGLAIVKQIVEAHGSRIQVQSKLGKGTLFSFRLKKRKPTELAVASKLAP